MSSWADQLEEDLSWREGELASLKSQLIHTQKNSQKHTALLRAMWAMLYAHFEGFCKFSWDLYLDKLQSLQTKRECFIPEICKLSLCKDFKELKGDMSHDNLWEFCSQEFKNLLSQKIEFKIKLETNSNLWPNLFKENIEKLGLICNTIDTYHIHIRSLVSRRNEIAHGKKLVIDNIEEYLKYEDATLLIMHDLAINIVESIEKESYLK